MPVRREDVATRLYEIDPFEFEHLIADIWDHLGWDTEVTSKAQDGGIDVVARKTLPFRQKQYIQAKRHSRQNNVAVTTVRECASLTEKDEPTRDQSDIVVLVTTGSLTKQAKREADELNVKTVEGRELSRMIADWDLSDIAANYLAVDETDSTTQPVEVSDDPVEAYEGSPQWNNIEGFNEMVETPQADTYELVATLDGDVAYRLTHGSYCDGVPDSFVNIHTLRDYSAAEKEELNRVSDVFGIRFRANVVADGDRAIYDKTDTLGQLKTRRTVRIGRQIANRVYGRPFADIDVDITRV